MHLKSFAQCSNLHSAGLFFKITDLPCSYAGPEHAVSQIFTKARQSAPCILVFEDLDSLITPAVRSYFLNEVDGLQANDGIFMIGSTNHLDKLDPAFKSRPSRFDRKFEFKDPDAGERVLYCEFWRNKILKGDGGVEFPRALCDKIAGITAGFSFAYLQEAFVGALLAIAAEDEDENEKEEGLCRTQSEEEFELVNDAVEEKRMEAGGGDEGDDKDLEKLVLWKAIKKQVEVSHRKMMKHIAMSSRTLVLTMICRSSRKSSEWELVAEVVLIIMDTLLLPYSFPII